MNKTPAWRPLMQSAYKLPLSFDPAPIVEEIHKAESRSAWVDHWADSSAIPGTWVFIPLIARPEDLPGANETRG